LGLAGHGEGYRVSEWSRAALPAWIRDRKVLATASSHLRARRETVEAAVAAWSEAAATRSG
jgi:hypothetical protein